MKKMLMCFAVVLIAMAVQAQMADSVDKQIAIVRACSRSRL